MKNGFEGRGQCRKLSLSFFWIPVLLVCVCACVCYRSTNGVRLCLWQGQLLDDERKEVRSGPEEVTLTKISGLNFQPQSGVVPETILVFLPHREVLGPSCLQRSLERDHPS